MIFWRDTITIISKMFEILEMEIAKLLGVSKQTLSKVKNGEQGASNKFAPSVIYRKVFNPATSGSPAYGKKPVSLLTDLKMTIEVSFPTVYESLADCWDEKDYQKFVTALLKRTRSNLRPPKTGNKDLTSDTNERKAQSVYMRDLFLMAVRDYKVMDIINRKPAILNRYDVADLNNFLRDIDIISTRPCLKNKCCTKSERAVS